MHTRRLFSRARVGRATSAEFIEESETHTHTQKSCCAPSARRYFLLSVLRARARSEYHLRDANFFLSLSPFPFLSRRCDARAFSLGLPYFLRFRSRTGVWRAFRLLCCCDVSLVLGLERVRTGCKSMVFALPIAINAGLWGFGKGLFSVVMRKWMFTRGFV